MKHHRKLLTRDLIFWLCIIGLFLVLNGYFIRCYGRNQELIRLYGDNYRYDAESCLRQALSVVFPIFGIFLILSYSMFQRFRRDGFYELNHLYAERRNYLVQLSVLIVLDILIAVNALAWVLVLYRRNCTIRPDYLVHIIENILVWYGLVMLVPILAGYVLSLIRNKRFVLCMAVGLLLLQSPLLEDLAPELAYDRGINLYPFVRWVRLMPFPRGDVISGFVYTGYPVVRETYWQPVFWISVCLFFPVVTLCPKGKRRRLGLGLNAILLLCAAGILAYMPADTRVEYMNVNLGVQHPEYYYRFSPRKPVTKEEPADFSVSGYKMDLEITDRLEGEVTVYIEEETGRDHYYFTLYHTYQVTGVRDQDGRRLQFQQYDDYVDVEDTGDIEAVTISYRGSAPGFYSHEKGIRLSSYVPYYPRPGYHVVFGKTEEIQNTEYFPILEKDICSFDIQIHTGQQVYSNLPEQEKNHFQGEANGVFLLSGFVEEYDYRGVRILYPYDGREWDRDGWEKSIDYLKAFEAEHLPPERETGVETIVLCPEDWFNRGYTFGSNWAEMQVLYSKTMRELWNDDTRPDEREFILYYQFYLEHGYNERNAVWIN